MYNRYIPAEDGSYRRQRIDTPATEKHESSPLEQSEILTFSPPESKDSVLGKFDTEEILLIVILLLLLMDDQDEDLVILIAALAFLIL